MELLVYLQGAIITVMTAMIGFFFKKFSDSVDSLNSTVHSLRVIVEQEKIKYTGFEKTCAVNMGNVGERFTRVENKQDEHAKWLTRHETEITKLRVIHEPKILGATGTE